MTNDDRRRHKRRIAIVVLILLSGGLICFQWQYRGNPEKRAEALYKRARLSSLEGKSQEAEMLARQAVDLNPSLFAAHHLAAESALSRKDYSQALDDLSQIPEAAGKEWLEARQLAAEILHHHVFRFKEAEQAYLSVLAASPDDVSSNDGYARLLGLCGRRTDAIPHVLRLIRAGEDTDLLILLSRESGQLNDLEMLEAARKADPTDPNPLLGLAQAADSAQDPSAALQLLRQAALLEGLPQDFEGRMGRQLLANERFDELEAWRNNLPRTPQSAEAWMVLGELAERAKDHRGAIRCYWEALKRLPESLHAHNRLAQNLVLDNQADVAEPFLKRVQELNDFRDRQRVAILSEERPTFADVLKMVEAYRTVGRLWEAYAWGRLALVANPNHPELNQRLQELKTQLPTLPLELTAAEYNLARRIDLSHYPVPSFGGPSTEPSSRGISENIAFHQHGADIGFRFSYYDGTPGTTYRMFEFAGGGMGVMDFDRDGDPDLFCTQGRTWGQSEPDEHFDRLFQNLEGTSFREISASAGFAAETGFGQGVSAGDVNNDGFPDLYVANIGTNSLWINNGDGTFTDQSSALKDQAPCWTTSCLIADLNGDSFPDLYDVNYLKGEDVFDRLCDDKHGGKTMCGPQDFEPERDRVWLGNGEGGFSDQTRTFLDKPPDGKGLGIAAMNLGDHRLSLFIANDTTANFLYTFDSPNAASMTESALVTGLAFNGEGKAQACMGVAVGDCTEDGRLDLLVTNFLHEGSTLYSQIEDGLFQDRTRDFGLYAPSLPVLGFGTQFLDANLDGRLELFVANGYTHDLTKFNVPYRMPSHVFEWTGQRFEQLPESQLGSWSKTLNVGRAAARWDWNLDRKPDLAVGLLEDPSFLLTNVSQTKDNAVTLQLAATSSARDAIGTTITVSIGESTWTYQLTAGDGYQCSNERKLLCGCGQADQIDRIQVVWPSGNGQEFFDVPTSQSLVLVEGGTLMTIRDSVNSVH